MWNNFFFIGLPYITVTLFFGGIIYRGLSGMMGGYRNKWDLSSRGDYLWTTRSTGFFRPRFHRTRILVPALGHTHSSVRSSHRIYRRRVQSCFLGWFFQMGGPRRWNSFSLRSCMGFFTQNNNSAGQGHEHAR